MRYFVMLSLSNGSPTPMVDENGDPFLFNTKSDAYKAAERNPIGQAYPYEVYQWAY